MIKKVLLLTMLALSTASFAQVGINCQYIPGLQFGSVKIKTNNTALGDYKYGAGMPLMMIDRFGAKWYWNLDMNALYYAATSMNKAADNQIKIAKTEGGMLAGRMGRLFGKGDQQRIGVCINWGWTASNLDSNKKTMDVPSYMNLGAGLLYYKKFGSKMRITMKLGYEGYSAKKYIEKASGIFFESTVAYMVFQKYGFSISPCYYSKKFNYTPSISGVALPATEAKLSSLVFRIGLTKFL